MAAVTSHSVRFTVIDTPLTVIDTPFITSQCVSSLSVFHVLVCFTSQCVSPLGVFHLSVCFTSQCVSPPVITATEAFQSGELAETVERVMAE